MSIIKNVYQIKINLKHVKPAIWRRIIIEDSIKLSELHKVIQTVMGWTNSHLHQFIIEGKYYGNPDEESVEEIVDYKKVKLRKVLLLEKQKILYEYDFGDGWEHDIVLEKVFVNQTLKVPQCVAGKGNCPPEDCGGPYGFMELMKIISEPKHEEYKEMIEWLGEDYDPNDFDKEIINSLLLEKDYGCYTFL